MSAWPEGNALVWCEGAFRTTNGKTAHGLVRRSERYRLVAVLDSTCAGRDAGELLDGRTSGVPLVADLDAGLAEGERRGIPATHLVIGLAPDGGRLPEAGRAVVRAALERGLHVDSGLHDFLSDDPECARLAAAKGLRIRDVRRTPDRADLHGFTGKIEEVAALRVALLGTDSAVGKRTTAWVLVDGLRARGVPAELVGTGQTAWMQGARYGFVLDSCVNDFVAGEIEHWTWSAWKGGAQAVVLEGQGSLLNPAYPGGFELLAAGRPHTVVLQHSPTREEYDGFPGFPMHPLEKQVAALEMLTRPGIVCAVTLNHEGLDAAATRRTCAELEERHGLPVVDVLLEGPERLVDAVLAAREAAA